MRKLYQSPCVYAAVVEGLERVCGTSSGNINTTAKNGVSGDAPQRIGQGYL